MRRTQNKFDYYRNLLLTRSILWFYEDPIKDDRDDKSIKLMQFIAKCTI